MFKNLYTIILKNYSIKHFKECCENHTTSYKYVTFTKKKKKIVENSSYVNLVADCIQEVCGLI